MLKKAGERTASETEVLAFVLKVWAIKAPYEGFFSLVFERCKAFLVDMNRDDTKHSTCGVKPQWSQFLYEETQAREQQA